MNEFKYKQGDRVWFDTGIICGYGIIKGVTTVPQPRIGQTYIVEATNNKPTFPSADYPFDHIGVFECFLKMAEEVSPK